MAGDLIPLLERHLKHARGCRLGRDTPDGDFCTCGLLKARKRLRAALRSDSYGPEPVGPSANANADEPLRSDSPVSKSKMRRQVAQDGYITLDGVKYIRPEGAIPVWLTNQGIAGVYLREAVVDGETYYRPENGPAIGLQPGESMPYWLVPRPQVGDPNDGGE